jgi:hypothetical protein
MSLTDDPKDPRLKRGIDDKPGPQNDTYLVLSEAERAKGFIRPVRERYVHKGRPGPKLGLRDLTEEEHKRYDQFGYVKFESYGDPNDPKLSVTGRFWTQRELDTIENGCGVITTMGIALAETYARNPTFYGATYCVGCRMHKPVIEFRWIEDDDSVGPVVGT